MSRYSVGRPPLCSAISRASDSYVVIDVGGQSFDGAPMIVDHFRTRATAERASRLLNEGLATVDHHAVVGCKVREIVEPMAGSLFDTGAFAQLRGQTGMVI